MPTQESRTARDIISDLLDFVEEWHFEDNSRETNICYTCGVDGKKTKFKHAEGCKLRRLLDEAERFIEVPSETDT